MSSRLFQLGHFTLHSGEESRWKIECEALSPDDWAVLAEIIREHIPPFSSVLGIPRGGMPLQQALEVFGTGNMAHPLLLVDDVYTTGRSFDDMLVSVQRDGWTGASFWRGRFRAGARAAPLGPGRLESGSEEAVRALDMGPAIRS